MLQIIAVRDDGTTFFACGIHRKDLERMVQGDICLTDLAEAVPAGEGMVFVADTHEEMVDILKELGLNVRGVVDRRQPWTK